MICNMTALCKYILVFCLLQLAFCDEVKILNTFTKQYDFGWYHSRQETILGTRFPTANTIVSAFCSKDGSCDRLIFNEIEGDKVKFEKSCSLDMKVKNKQGSDIFGLGVQQKHSLVFAHLVSEKPEDRVNYKIVGKIYAMYKVLNVDTCKAADLVVPLNNKDITDDFVPKIHLIDGSSIMAYMNGEQELFDAFFPNYDQCKGSLCRITFDSQGKLVNGPVGYLSEEYNVNGVVVYPLSNKSGSRNYLAMIMPPFDDDTFVRYSADPKKLSPEFKANREKADKDTIQFKILTADGKAIDLPTKMNVTSAGEYRGIFSMNFDTANEAFSFCETVHPSKTETSGIKCTQYDSRGNKKFDSTLSVKDVKKVNIVRIRNTVEHGLLVVTQVFSKDTSSLTLRQIKTDGTEGKSYNLPYYECKKDYKDGSLFEVGKNKYCLPVLCESTVVNKCFSL